MTTTRARLSRRGVAVLCATALVVAVLGTLAVARSLAPDCSVAGARTVDLNRDQAEAASAAVAAVVRRSGSLASARAAVVKSTDLGTEDATVLAGALSGRTKAGFFCRYGGSDQSEPDALGPDGLTHRAERVRLDMAAHFGNLPLGGFAPGGVHSGHMVGSAHYEGRAIDAFFRPITAAGKQHGWALAQYLVANSARLEINTVIFDAMIWTAAQADQGWRTYSVDRGTASAATYRILEHRDHVHVDVAD